MNISPNDMNINAFLTSGYLATEYFCSRKEESKILIREMSNGNNVALISTLSMGNTRLIHHCFKQAALKDHLFYQSVTMMHLGAIALQD